MFCDDDCGSKQTKEDEDTEKITCIFCRLEDTTDYDLLGFMLTKYNLTREQLLDMWRLEQDGE